jgi:hypothetical protein
MSLRTEVSTRAAFDPLNGYDISQRLMAKLGISSRTNGHKLTSVRAILWIALTSTT